MLASYPLIDEKTGIVYSSDGKLSLYEYATGTDWLLLPCNVVCARNTQIHAPALTTVQHRSARTIRLRKWYRFLRSPTVMVLCIPHKPPHIYTHTKGDNYHV